jgi:hypothetical protein
MSKIIDLHGKPIKVGDEPTIDSEANAIIPTEPNHYVVGVQIWEHGVITGVALYRKMVDARKVKEILNAKYAELNVKHEAKLIEYPVY